MKFFAPLLLLTILICASCGSNDPCNIYDLEVTSGECTCIDAYPLTIDFSYDTAPTEFFTVYARNNKEVGTYRLSSLPLTVEKFQLSGLAEDYIKICLDEEANCCLEYEFLPPDCNPNNECNILDVIAEVGDCNNDGSYVLELDIIHENAGNDFYDLFTMNNTFIGFYRLDELPLRISNFQPSDFEYEFLKVCINDTPNCCYEVEFLSPDCTEEDCDIFDLEVDTGDCVGEDYYTLLLNFESSNPSHSNFEVFTRADNRIGNFPLDALPLEIEEFKTSGKDYDYIKVCMSDDPECCAVIEFLPPSCLWEECKIYDIVTEVGDCNDDGTYPLIIDFNHSNSSNSFFDVYIRNGVHIGFYRLDALPLTIPKFEKSGSDYDFIKICINDNPDCCIENEFLPPGC